MGNNLISFLIGKSVKVKTDMGVEVELTITGIDNSSYDVETEPATSSNDWWPNSYRVTKYTVHFNTGKSKQYDRLEDIQFTNLL